LSVVKGWCFDLKGKEVRMRTLELMERSTVLLLLMNTFSRMDDFGVPISNLKANH
jgi:hypothetical protein